MTLSFHDFDRLSFLFENKRYTAIYLMSFLSIYDIIMIVTSVSKRINHTLVTNNTINGNNLLINNNN